MERDTKSTFARSGGLDIDYDNDDDVFDDEVDRAGSRAAREWKDSDCPGEVGDIIEFDRKTYLHYGVNVGRQHVAHLTGDGPVAWMNYLTSSSRQALIKVERFSAVAFGSKQVRVWNKHDARYKPYPPEVVANRAISSVGGRGYNLLFHNCEHFANWCRYGVRVSHQAQILGMGTSAICGAILGSAAGPVGTVAGATAGVVVAACTSFAWLKLRYQQVRDVSERRSDTNSTPGCLSTLN